MGKVFRSLSVVTSIAAKTILDEAFFNLEVFCNLRKTMVSGRVTLIGGQIRRRPSLLDCKMETRRTLMKIRIWLSRTGGFRGVISACRL